MNGFGEPNGWDEMAVQLSPYVNRGWGGCYNHMWKRNFSFSRSLGQMLDSWDHPQLCLLDQRDQGNSFRAGDAFFKKELVQHDVSHTTIVWEN